jgi:1-deoxy-D-xylulose-5-phosphate synthase
MLYTGFTLDQPSAIRYPRGGGPGVEIEKEMTALPVGKAELRRTGKNVAILAFGTMVTPALEVADELDATVVNMRFIKPLDEEMILQMASQHELIVTVEENVIQGGAGAAVSECLSAHGVAVPVLHYGLPDRMIQHGSREEMLADAGLTREGLLDLIKARRRVGLSGNVAAVNR